MADAETGDLDLFKNYLHVVIKVQRNETQTFSPEQLALADGQELTFEMLDADEDDAEGETVVGTKSGPAFVGDFASVDDLIEFLQAGEFTDAEGNDLGTGDLKLRKNRADDSHLYAAAAAEGNGGDE